MVSPAKRLAGLLQRIGGAKVRAGEESCQTALTYGPACQLFHISVLVRLHAILGDRDLILLFPMTYLIALHGTSFSTLSVTTTSFPMQDPSWTARDSLSLLLHHIDDRNP